MSDTHDADAPETANIEGVASELAAADHAVALTGAGVSTASGIPDFRSEGGIWDRYDPMDFHVSRFESDPEGFWRDRIGMVDAVFGDEVDPL